LKNIAISSRLITCWQEGIGSSRWSWRRRLDGVVVERALVESRQAPELVFATSRESLAGRHPAHVTLRVRPGVPSLRFAKLVRAFERSLAQASERGDFRVVHYSLQSNHVHLLVEAADATALARGMKSVGARLARAVNRVFGLVGPVLADRYHLHVPKDAA